MTNAQRDAIKRMIAQTRAKCDQRIFRLFDTDTCAIVAQCRAPNIDWAQNELAEHLGGDDTDPMDFAGERVFYMPGKCLVLTTARSIEPSNYS